MGIFRGVIFPGGSLMGGNFPGGNFPGGNFPRTLKNKPVSFDASEGVFA